MRPWLRPVLLGGLCAGILSVAYAVTRAGVGQEAVAVAHGPAGPQAGFLLAHPACALAALGAFLSIAGIWGHGLSKSSGTGETEPAPDRPPERPPVQTTIDRLNSILGRRLWRSATLLVVESPGLKKGVAFDRLIEAIRPLLAPDELIGELSPGRLLALLEPSPSCTRCWVELATQQVYDGTRLPLVARVLPRPHGGWPPGTFTHEAQILLKADAPLDHSEGCLARGPRPEPAAREGGTPGGAVR